LINIFHRKSFRNRRRLHQFHRKLIGRAPGDTGPDPQGFYTGRGFPLFDQLMSYIIHSIDQLMPEQFLLVLYHGQYPVDLDIDDPDERQSDQDKNDGENFFQSGAFWSNGKFIKRIEGLPCQAPVWDVFNEGFTKKGDFSLKCAIFK